MGTTNSARPRSRVCDGEAKVSPRLDLSRIGWPTGLVLFAAVVLAACASDKQNLESRGPTSPPAATAVADDSPPVKEEIAEEVIPAAESPGDELLAAEEPRRPLAPLPELSRVDVVRSCGNAVFELDGDQPTNTTELSAELRDVVEGTILAKESYEWSLIHATDEFVSLFGFDSSGYHGFAFLELQEDVWVPVGFGDCQMRLEIDGVWTLGGCCAGDGDDGGGSIAAGSGFRQWRHRRSLLVPVRSGDVDRRTLGADRRSTGDEWHRGADLPPRRLKGCQRVHVGCPGVGCEVRPGQPRWAVEAIRSSAMAATMDASSG